MSIKIKISYTDDQELEAVIKKLQPIKEIKRQQAKGKFKRAYIVPKT